MQQSHDPKGRCKSAMKATTTDRDERASMKAARAVCRTRMKNEGHQGNVPNPDEARKNARRQEMR